MLLFCVIKSLDVIVVAVPRCQSVDIENLTLNKWYGMYLKGDHLVNMDSKEKQKLHKKISRKTYTVAFISKTIRKTILFYYAKTNTLGISSTNERKIVVG